MSAVQEVFPGSAPAAKAEEGAEAATERLRQQLLAVGGTLPSIRLYSMPCSSSLLVDNSCKGSV